MSMTDRERSDMSSCRYGSKTVYYALVSSNSSSYTKGDKERSRDNDQKLKVDIAIRTLRESILQPFRNMGEVEKAVYKEERDFRSSMHVWAAKIE